MKNKGTAKLVKITARAKIVKATSPNLTWQERISRATRELKHKRKI
jgi:hypothetical protein